MGERKISWTKIATRQFNAAIKYIRKDSAMQADSVKVKILDKINKLSDDTSTHRQDPYKKNNDGNYLYFEILHYRITYYAAAKEVFIIRVRHSKMEPKIY